MFGGAIGTFYGTKQSAIWTSITAFFLYNNLKDSPNFDDVIKVYCPLLPEKIQSVIDIYIPRHWDTFFITAIFLKKLI